MPTCGARTSVAAAWPGADLAGADLTGADFAGADLSEANLRGTIFDNTSLIGANARRR